MKRPAIERMKAVEMFKSGMSPKKIAEHTGKSIKTIYVTLSEARRQGLLPNWTGRFRTRGEYTQASSPIKYMSNIAREQNKQMGSMETLINELPYDVTKWLIAQTPENSSVVTMIAAIIKDTYFEEHQK